ncbi:hypothetical protein [Hymenobacter sp.]|uniref:hypothetical protein n=1 Tax=Hymenobacter sp. TaxID=1898978 RepID=UPI00286C197D|nr:hypothetical protein [Hymenobacter sp.]
MPLSPSDIYLRGWEDAARNKRVGVYYAPPPADGSYTRSVYVESFPLDPGRQMETGGSPQDGIPENVLLLTRTDGPAPGERVRVYSQRRSFYAYIFTEAGDLLVLNTVVTGPASPVPGAPGRVAFDVRFPVDVPTRPVDLRVYRQPGGEQAPPVAERLGIAAPARSEVDLPPGDYLFFFRSGAGELQRYLTVPPYVSPLPAVCRDEAADNYVDDPTRASDPGLCTYSPPLALAAPLPALVPNGRPVLVTLAAAALPGAVPAPAEATLDCSFLGGAVGVVLTLNGYRFTSGPLVDATRFEDAASLAEALNAVAALAAGYRIRAVAGGQVRLTARADGTGGNLDVAVSNPARVVATAAPGVNRYRSESRRRWGCFLEVWTGAPESNPSPFSDRYADAYRDRYGRLAPAPAGPALPVLVQRLEQELRADNAYVFDIAPALRQFTGHAYPNPDGSCPDRLSSYFLRYGESYATAASTRRERYAAASETAWTIDAVELGPEVAGGLYLLSRRPGPWRSAGPAHAAPTLLLARPGGLGAAALPATTELLTVRYDGLVQVVAGPPLPAGTVTRLALPAAVLAGQRTAELRLDPGTGGSPVRVGALALLDRPAAENTALTFANGQGGFDTVVFEGLREEGLKRTAATYATPTGSATRAAETAEPFRLHSGPLTADEYRWLRRELGNSPSAWLETPQGPLAVTLTGLAADNDERAGAYALVLDATPAEEPIYGITN